MGLSEWKIILDELIRMVYIVKEEPDSDCNELELRSFDVIVVSYRLRAILF
jgi:hypothetical protein